MSVYTIAEVGVEHGGDVSRAKEMVKLAKGAGADAVKFQLYEPEALTISAGEQDLLRKVGLTQQEIESLKTLCEQEGIDFLCTPHDIPSLRFLQFGLGVTSIKIGSGDMENFELLEQLVRGLDIYFSTGIALNPKRIVQSAGILLTKRPTLLTMMHCQSLYPCPVQQAGLAILRDMVSWHVVQQGAVRVGYSDHTASPGVCIRAVSLGAKVIEAHFTKGGDYRGPEYDWSMSPETFGSMARGANSPPAVDAMSMRDTYMGDMPEGVRKEKRARVGKSWTSSRDIKAGEVFDESNVSIRRPGTGIPAWFRFYGHAKAARDIPADSVITSPDTNLPTAMFDV